MKGSCRLIVAALLLLATYCLGSNSSTPESFDSVAARARAAMTQDKTAEAIRLYGEATTLKPSWAEGWWHLGTLLYDAGRFRESRDAFAHFVTVEKNQAGPGFAMLGLCDFQLKQYHEALAALEHGRLLGLGPNLVFTRDVLYHEGILNSLVGYPEVAVQRLTLEANEIAAAHPEAPKQAVLGDVELLDAFGIAALRIPKLPSAIKPEQAALIRKAGHAQALIALQDRADADQELQQLVSDYASAPGVHYFYGVFLLKEHPPLAVGEFQREIEVSPSSAAARIQLAFECLRTADYEQGLKFAKEALALTPNDFAAHVVCGRLWLEQGNNERAIEELQKAVRLAPGSPDAHFALARALAGAGRSKDAARERTEFERLKASVDAVDLHSK